MRLYQVELGWVLLGVVRQLRGLMLLRLDFLVLGEWVLLVDGLPLIGRFQWCLR